VRLRVVDLVWVDGEGEAEEETKRKLLEARRGKEMAGNG
jgi:hypothetical protein